MKTKRIISLIIVLVLVLSMLPVIAPVEAEAATVPTYIASIAVSYGAKESTPKDILTGQGYTVIDCDLNKGCGKSSHYVYMGYKTTTDHTKAITGIFFRLGDNPPNSATFEGVTAYLLGGSSEPNPGENTYVDLNAGAGGAYIYTYVTRDSSRAPITDIVITTDVTASFPGYISTGVDLNDGAGGDFVYLRYKQFSESISMTLYFINSTHVRDNQTYSRNVKNHTQTYTSSIAFKLGELSRYSNNKYTLYLAGWRDDTTAAAPEYVVARPSVTYMTSGTTFYAVYENTVSLSYNANGGSGAPAAQSVKQYFNIGHSSHSVQTVSTTVSSGVPTHPNKCKFLGWSTSSSATSPTYTAGSSISMTDNVTLYAVYDSSHNPAADDGDCTTAVKCIDCGKETTAAKAHTPAADDGDCTTAIKCTVCGKVTTAAKAHTEQTVRGYAATCTKTGLTDGVKCSVCGKTLTAQKEIPATGHSWVDATCTAPKTCSVCDTTEGKALGHSWSDATCTAPKTCSVCDTTEGEALGHTEETVPGYAATCTETGLTDGVKCSACGETLAEQEEILATDHENLTTTIVDATCTEDGSVTVTCDDCGEVIYTESIPAPGHSYVDGTCTICGEADPDYVALFNIPGVTMSLGNDLAMYFYVPVANVADGYYAEVTKTYADGRDDVVETVLLSGCAKQTMYGAEYYMVAFDGISAKEMTDELYCIVYDANGEQVSNKKDTSVETYALGMLNATTNAELQTVLADMLNYGAQAQSSFSYNTSDLANADMTQTHKGYATAQIDMSALDAHVVKGAGWAARSLTLKSNIQMTVFFDTSVVTKDMVAKISYTNHNGNPVSYEIPGSSFQVYDATHVYLNIETLVAADIETVVSIDIYDGDTVVSRSEYNMAEYCKAQSTDTMLIALAKFCTAAYAYFH